MTKITLGIICGLAFGIIDVLIMIPLKFENRRKQIEAMTAAFIDRFMIGFLVPNVNLGMNLAVSGGLLGLLLSLPSAIVTRVYAPIVGIGVIGGVIIGFVC